MTFVLFLKVKDEECPRINTSDSSELDSPSTLIWEITQQIDRWCTVRVNSLSPVLTVPVWPRFTLVEDSRYTVMNRDTFPKK